MKLNRLHIFGEHKLLCAPKSKHFENHFNILNALSVVKGVTLGTKLI